MRIEVRFAVYLNPFQSFMRLRVNQGDVQRLGRIFGNAAWATKVPASVSVLPSRVFDAGRLTTYTYGVENLVAAKALKGLVLIASPQSSALRSSTFHPPSDSIRGSFRF
jgi:hypothetical protein